MKKIIAGIFFGLIITVTCRGDTTDRQIESLVFTCYTCHGPGGDSPGAVPAINELSADEIVEKLNEFRQDQGEPTIMNRIARGYSEGEISEIADYLARLND